MVASTSDVRVGLCMYRIGCFPFDKKFQSEIPNISHSKLDSIFWLFAFSGTLGQPREVYPKNCATTDGINGG